MFRGSTFMEAAATEEDKPLDLMNEDIELDDPDGYMNINTINIEDDLGGDEKVTSEPEFDDSNLEPISEPVDDRPIVQATQIDIMGTDDSDVHNEFERKDVDTLNTLIASEQSAIGEYFTAAKDTNNELLRRLYSDIGDEERFHSEQLIFAKSQLTGEKYIPRDPNVKKEYEELMAMGMDEETAMATAVDKVGLMPREGFALVDPVEEVEECVHLQSEIDDIESSLYQEALLEMIMMSPAVTSLDERDHAVSVMMEAYLNEAMSAEIYLEAVENVSDMPKKEVKTIENPFKVLLRWIGKLLSLIKNLGHKVAVWATKMRNRRKDKFAWISRHGIGALFSKGVGLYFWNDDPNKGKVGFSWTPVIQYNHFLLKMMLMLAHQWGLNIDATPQLMFDRPVPEIPISNLEGAVERLNNINMYKTKVLAKDANQPAILTEIFGYTQDKINYTETNTTTGEVTHKADSQNVFNVFSALINDLSKYLDIAKNLSTALSQMAVTNQDKMKPSVDAAKSIVKAYNMLISALTSDLNQCMKLNNEVLAATQTKDQYDLEHDAGAYGNISGNLKKDADRAAEQYKKAREAYQKDPREANANALKAATDDYNAAAQALKKSVNNPQQQIADMKTPPQQNK